MTDAEFDALVAETMEKHGLNPEQAANVVRIEAGIARGDVAFFDDDPAEDEESSHSSHTPNARTREEFEGP